MLAAAMIVVAGMCVVNGRPNATRHVSIDEVAEYAPKIGQGVATLIVKSGLLVVATWVARRRLAIRL